MQNEFLKAMIKVNYAEQLDHKEVFKAMGLTERQVYNNRCLFMAFEIARKKYMDKYYF